MQKESERSSHPERQPRFVILSAAKDPFGSSQAAIGKVRETCNLKRETFISFS
jgi:hypothetical protein